jgi:molecular chaperone GrpE
VFVAAGVEGEGPLKRERNGYILQQDMADNDEIEIIEVVGLDEDSPGAGVREDDAGSGDGEITVDFDEDRPEQRSPAASSDDVNGGAPRAVSDREMLVRLRADFDNFKKRVEREREAAERHASAGLVSRLLPVLDNFERALAAEVPSDDGRAFRDGVALIFRQLLEELRREGLASVDSLGQPFDPNHHEAVATDRVPGLPGNTVVEELRRGYRLHDRLLRPAQVKVCLEDEAVREPGDKDGN